MEDPSTIPFVMFVATYFMVAMAYSPGYRIDHTGAAIMGAILMIGMWTVCCRLRGARSRSPSGSTCARACP
jgi:hypothetical protein